MLRLKPGRNSQSDGVNPKGESRGQLEMGHKTIPRPILLPLYFRSVYFNEEDKRWDGPRFIGLAVVTLLICISAIYFMARTAGCSLQIVP